MSLQHQNWLASVWLASPQVPKGSGRKRGQEPKTAVRKRLEALEVDPIEGLCRIAQKAEDSDELSIAAQGYKELG